jgi:hypothetical protein
MQSNKGQQDGEKGGKTPGKNPSIQIIAFLFHNRPVLNGRIKLAQLGRLLGFSPCATALQVDF